MMFVRDYIRKGKKVGVRFGKRYQDPLTGAWKTATVTAKKDNRHTRNLAEVALEKKIQKKQSEITGKFNLHRDMTLGQLYDIYIKEKSITWRINTKKAYLTSYKKFFQDFSRDIKITKITPLVMMNYFDNLNHDVLEIVKGKAPSKGPAIHTISGAKVYYARISTMFNFAVRKQFLKKNPCREAHIDWPKDNHHIAIEKKYLDEDELVMVLDWYRKNYPVLADIFEWQYLTGLRFGEAIGLQVKNIDTQAKTALICGTVVPGNDSYSDQVKQPTTKTDSSYRTIHLSDRAMNIFYKRSKGKKKSDFLFTRKNGKLPVIQSVEGTFKRFRKHHDLDKILTTHTFRHTHVSKLAELGAPLYLIQHDVGHSRSKITQQVYLHVTQKAEQQLADKLNLM